MDARDDLERGRAAYAEGAWAKAFRSLTEADRDRDLDPDDLELLARSAYMLGRDDDYVDALERAHHARVDAGDLPRAVRCTVWIGHSFLFRGEVSRAGGWFARGERLLDEHGQDCAERGYLLIPVWLQQMGGGDHEGGLATAVEAEEIGRRFGDTDLVWLARHDQGRALIKQGRVEDGLKIVDEALVVATAGELSPIVTGIVYCNTIAFCRDVYELRHVREWTDALTRWCERQPEMVTHNGVCLVHRAEIRLLEGAWDTALDEARNCAERFIEGALNRIARGKSFYLQGQVHRLRGAFELAEQSYRDANRTGYEPQPGLALLRLAQGDLEAAAAAIRRVVAERTDALARAEILPAYVEIMLADGNTELARAAVVEIEQIAQRWSSEALDATAAQARGAVALAEGHPDDALVPLRRALGTWNELAAHHEAARVRELIGTACRAMGDEDTAVLELEAAWAAFDRMGAELDRARVDALISGSPPVASHGLSDRELEVLRIVAAGRSNRQIATELVISEHTVARHLQNIFAKLGVSSRTEATAFAFSHDLV